MNKIGLADYGLNVWDGALYDYEDRFSMLSRIGFDGIERLEAKTADEAVEISAAARRFNLEFATCRGGCARETLLWTAALGKQYTWCESQSKDFNEFCRHVNRQIECSEKYGVRVGLHNHLGLVVETQQQLADFIENCPKCGIILDVGHLAAAGGDPLFVIEKYKDHLVAVHMKDYVYKDKGAQFWWDQIRFCELGAGVMGDLNRDILKKLSAVNFDGWIFVEHDTHLRNPEKDLSISLEYIKQNLK